MKLAGMGNDGRKRSSVVGRVVPDSNTDSEAIDADSDQSTDRTLIEDHYGRRMEELMMRIQTIESRAAYFQQEVSPIHRSINQ